MNSMMGRTKSRSALIMQFFILEISLFKFVVMHLTSFKITLLFYTHGASLWEHLKTALLIVDNLYAQILKVKLGHHLTKR